MEDKDNRARPRSAVIVLSRSKISGASDSIREGEGRVGGGGGRNAVQP